jgi:hypothetical protein
MFDLLKFKTRSKNILLKKEKTRTKLQETHKS